MESQLQSKQLLQQFREYVWKHLYNNNNHSKIILFWFISFNNLILFVCWFELARFFVHALQVNICFGLVAVCACVVHITGT